MDQPVDLPTLGETMKANADEVAAAVIDRWESIAEGEPWQALPPDLDHDHLPKLVR